ncbi:hypothetical protein ACU4GR_11325 [Methylobacterium oryzae CBMB20]
MMSPFLISVAFALVTTGAAALWALLVAADMSQAGGGRPGRAARHPDLVRRACGALRGNLQLGNEPRPGMRHG